MKFRGSKSYDLESSDEKHAYPKSVFFILGNEFCERFCFYGMRTILTIYLSQQLLYSEDTATTIYHLFAMLAYFTPVLGAVIADSWLGKFKTILYLSIVYVIGNIVLSAGAFPHPLHTMRGLSILGLFIIGVGTGGIKPCVSAFGGDQFHAEQAKQRERFFSVFYFMINCGSVFSTLLTPVLRSDVSCLDQESCFPLAFGVPALLMIIALVLFIAGKSLYVIEKPKGNVLMSVVKCMGHALSKKFRSSEKKKEHWLDYAEDKYGKKLVGDIKILLHILVLYIPLPVFWALFDQTGSRWILQATKMDGEFFGMTIKPDQLQAANPILILAFIPLFDYAVYPLLAKCNLLKKPLQRICVGGFLAGISFVVAGFIELGIESTLPVLPTEGHSELAIFNLNNCPVNIDGPQKLVIPAYELKTIYGLTKGTEYVWNVSPVAGETGCGAFSGTFKPNNNDSIESALITAQGTNLKTLWGKDEKEKSDIGQPKVRVFFSIANMPKDSSFKFVGSKEIFNISANNGAGDSTIGRTEYKSFEPGMYKLYIPVSETDYEEEPIGEYKFRSGGSYIVGIEKNSATSKFAVQTMVEPNVIHLLFQLPQYIILTAAEIMFSITGLEFSYSQSPLEMKSVLQAAWLMTVAFGNLIVFIVAEASLFEKRSWELFMFAILMGLDMLIFAVMAYFYKYVDIGTKSEDEVGKEGGETNGKVNEGYLEETDFSK